MAGVLTGGKYTHSLALGRQGRRVASKLWSTFRPAFDQWFALVLAGGDGAIHRVLAFLFPVEIHRPLDLRYHRINSESARSDWLLFRRKGFGPKLCVFLGHVVRGRIFGRRFPARAIACLQ